MEGSNRTPAAGRQPVILELKPDPRGFLSRYLLALTPLFLLILSLVTAGGIRGFLGASMPNLSGPLGPMLLSGLSDMMEISVLLTAPVCIYILFVTIGWWAGFTEMWTGSALALGLSSLAGLLLVTVSPDMSMNRILDLLYWIAYLIQPASVVAVIIVMGWTEKFRRSIRYTITSEGLILEGGIWKKQENMLPLHEVGGLVVEQDPVGRLFHTGTVIPAAGRKDYVSVRPGYAKAGQEVSRYPLDCLYGIREPEKVMALLKDLISRSTVRREERAPNPGEFSGKR